MDDGIAIAAGTPARLSGLARRDLAVAAGTGKSYLGGRPVPRMPDWPFAPSTLGLAVMVAVLAGTYLAGAYWIYRDASARGSDRPGGWVSWWLLFTVFAAVYYLRVRDRIGERAEPVTRAERAASAVVVATFVVLLGGTLVLPPDPYSQLSFVPPALAVTLPLVYGGLLALERARATSG